ncbi:hypothetical protein [Kaistella jeonii]|uniref:DUF998 domain-containing protein n=1 Tax=Kaistella jeonii TaxID=266749 RepID=A0A0C1CXD3_9FLAO|nr:hypothetical protein [Kaistella jeonii]KIA86100.1 hypothetical protein OA86_13840 [Kaistella jeonii]SFC35332.1 hypothetical protein SAMN05421876_11553 [Kaistella jeonii]VEI95360.1 Uncharacterised protein [Kaistella jeonii]
MITEISFEYWNKLSTQTVFITSLLGGFSILVIANLLVSELKTKLIKYVLLTSTLAAGLFLISIFAWTGVMMMTTPGYPEKIGSSEFTYHRLLGTTTLMLGIISLLSMVALVGWTKSRKMGIITTVIGILTFILILTTFS